jgi:hypothetical protein
MPCLARRCLTEFYPTAADLLAADLDRLGEALLIHLDSYEGRVKQRGRLHQGYLRDTFNNRNSGLGPMPPAPEYGPKQPEVTDRVMEAWYWLEREGFLIPEFSAHGWYLISTEGKRLLSTLLGSISGGAYVDPRTMGDNQAPENKANPLTQANKHVTLLERIVAKTNVSFETWVDDHNFGRTTFFDWKAARVNAKSLKGKVSSQKSTEIEKAIEEDAAELGLTTRTGSD